ncbi:hypothetical protein DFH08DRAFT_846297 [Mycena albidolilacea]|uniref:Uncharacterized protein n=1 Tax=Mycena albidolilacea TaxID=1033008 RepID=A0AAD7AIT3_9AGAR|nr:hypothetical protein DFH08DRAFT_846297 [Mycena albidolilacea]
MPDPNLAPTPPSIEPPLLVPDSASPGLFGPRSPRNNPYSQAATLPKSSSSPRIWMPDPNPIPTPPSVEPTPLFPDSTCTSPGLFAPRSPRDDAYSDTLRKSSSPGILGRSELFKVDADDSMTSFVDGKVSTMPLIPLSSAADILLSLLIDDVDMPPTTSPQAASAVVQRKRQHNVAFGGDKDFEEELARRVRPRLGEVDSSV